MCSLGAFLLAQSHIILNHSLLLNATIVNNVIGICVNMYLNLWCTPYTLQRKNTALHYGAKCGHVPVVEELIKAKADVNAVDYVSLCGCILE